MGLHNPLFSKAGWMTKGIQASAKTSVHAIWPAVATVKRTGVKCTIRLSRRSLHFVRRSGDNRAIVASDGDTEGALSSGTSSSR